MTYHSAIGGGADEGLVDALRAEFGAVLAARIWEAEKLDFLWDTRVSERYLGQYFGTEIGFEGDWNADFSRLAIMSFVDGVWYAGVCVADGDGGAVALLWARQCDDRGEAQAAFDRAV